MLVKDNHFSRVLEEVLIGRVRWPGLGAVEQVTVACDLAELGIGYFRKRMEKTEGEKDVPA